MPLVWRTLVVFAANREVCNADGSGYERVEEGGKKVERGKKVSYFIILLYVFRKNTRLFVYSENKS